jgi:hypothetical protein
MDSHKLILKPADATAAVDVSTDEDDALNEVGALLIKYRFPSSAVSGSWL